MCTYVQSNIYAFVCAYACASAVRVRVCVSDCICGRAFGAPACVYNIYAYYICVRSECIRVWVRACVRVCTYEHANVYACVRVRVCMCLYVYA